MKKTPRYAKPKLLFTGNPVWDQALCHFNTRFPRLMSHISAVGIGPRTSLFTPPEPGADPFAVLVLGEAVHERFEAIEDLASTLFLLARYLRFHARKDALPLPPLDNGGETPTVH